MSINIFDNEDIDDLNKEIQEIKFKTKKLSYFKSSFKDLTYLKTYTIDELETFEIDDAISLEKISNNYKLWIHIASPPYQIEYNSAIDKYARKLISSIYLSKSNIYMFPEILIDEIFSLNRKKKRASLSLGVVFNNDGTINSSEIVQSLIKPDFRLSYDDADELIDYAPKEEEDLSLISKILDKRKSLRISSGANEILESYGKVILKDKIPNIKVIDPTLSRLLISEAMILYGDLISDFTLKNKIPVPYRVQESSNSECINNFNHANKILYNFQLKKSFGKTYYSLYPSCHSSLGLDSYLHATSPIRRYSDLLVHYQIHNFLNNKALISNEEMEKNISIINNINRQNISRFREDQKIWINKWFEINKYEGYVVLILNWINKYKNICILYFLEYNFSSICFLKTKTEIVVGDKIMVKNITTNYKDILYFQFISLSI